MGNKIRRILKENKGSIGIGAMIVFIAMVLVAGIAASVLIQTSTTLESQALATGRETTAEVSSGLAVVSISGNNSSGLIQHLAIVVRTRAGSDDIDLAEAVIEISDSSTKNFLTYDDSTCILADWINGTIFNDSNYPSDATHFTVIVLEDADGSCSSPNSAVINSGDYVILGVNTFQCFGGLSPREDIWGLVMPEDGSPGVIYFGCPSSFTEDVVELQ
ncbi:MAG: flagellin [Asgard group archaeon]|nr:flagellin [Asgard group archaeon]